MQVFLSHFLPRLTGTAVLLGLIGACANVPPAPAVPEPVRLPGSFLQASGGEAEPAADWWRGFGDPVLDQLVAATLAQSPALRGAGFSIDEADALLRLALLGRRPDVSSRAGASASGTASSDSRIDVRGDAGVLASWEFDAFGRLDALVSAARFDRQAAIELRRDLAVSLIAETALAYITLRASEARLEVARRNSAAQSESLDLVRFLFENGRVTQLDLARAEAQFRTTLASIPVFEADIEASRSRLAALTGVPATSPRAVSLAPSGPDEQATIPELLIPLETGTPEAMLRRRPDIRLAEARLASALALGNVARAELFPRITVNASLTGLIRNRGVALSGDSVGLDFGPSISWAGPDLRRVYARIDASDARTQQIIASYENTVLNALAETETALSDYTAERRRRADLSAATDAARQALELSTLRYQQGLDSFLAVLDAQRTLLDAEDRLVVNEAETARRAVRAYRALGGIWMDDEPTAFRAETGSS
jgi:multidrug efflux system outer membrane protein